MPIQQRRMDRATHKKLPLAMALTRVDLERIDVQKDIEGEPVTLHSSDGSAYRVEGKLEQMARQAHQLALEGHAPGDLESGRVADVLQKILDSACKENVPEPEQIDQTPLLVTVAEEMADTILQEFANHLEKALEKRLANQRKDILRKACATLLR